jgi:NACalpha-BTF3-like transcription factor
MGPQLPSGTAIYRVPKMVKFWSDMADFEPKSQPQNFFSEGFSRAPCSNRILRNLNSNIEHSPQGEGSSSNQPVFEVKLSQIEGNKDAHQNASESSQNLDSTVSVHFLNQNATESSQSLVSAQFSNQSADDILTGIVQRTIVSQENDAAIEALNAQNSNLLDQILAYSPISEEVDVSQFSSTVEDDLHSINIDLFSSLDPEQSSISLR